MGPPKINTTVHYSDYNPFNSPKYYHPPCTIDYSNETSIDTCWQGDLAAGSAVADLRTEDADVREFWYEWIEDTVAKYEIDGLRIDSLKHVEKSFYPEFFRRSDVFALGELLDGNPVNYPSWFDYMSGLMNYPVYYWIVRAFKSKLSTMTELVKEIKLAQGLMKTSRMGVFLENHDQKRFANFNGDMALVKNAVAFTMLMDGIPIIYQGQEQHFSGGGDPDNRHGLWSSGYRTDTELYRTIGRLNRIRSLAIEQDQAYTPFQASPIWSDNDTVAMKKAQVVSVLTNLGVGPTSYNISLPASGTGYSAGQEIVDLFAPGCPRYTTASNGELTFEMTSAPKVFYPATRLGASDLCCKSGGYSQGAGVQVKVSLGVPVALSAGLSVDLSSCDLIEVEPAPVVCYVTFNQTRTTNFGDAVKILGNVPHLGDWDANQALALDSSYYSNSSNSHVLTMELEPGTQIEYTFLVVDQYGTVFWEGGSIKKELHTYTVPESCKGLTEKVHHIWESGFVRRRNIVRRRASQRVANAPFSYWR
ncbi:unnamed protein product [Discula destructiva]